MIIEVYLKIEKAIIRGNTPYGSSPSSIRRRFGSMENSIYTVKQSFSDMNELESHVVKIVQEYANDHSVEYHVYDTSRFRDGMRAFFKGVKTTPTIIIGKRKFVGGITKSDIAMAFKD